MLQLRHFTTFCLNLPFLAWNPPEKTPDTSGAPSKGSINGSPSPLLRDLQTGHALKVQVQSIWKYLIQVNLWWTGVVARLQKPAERFFKYFARHEGSIYRSVGYGGFRVDSIPPKMPWRWGAISKPSLRSVPSTLNPISSPNMSDARCSSPQPPSFGRFADSHRFFGSFSANELGPNQIQGIRCYIVIELTTFLYAYEWSAYRRKNRSKH